MSQKLKRYVLGLIGLLVLLTTRSCTVNPFASDHHNFYQYYQYWGIDWVTEDTLICYQKEIRRDESSLWPYRDSALQTKIFTLSYKDSLKSINEIDIPQTADADWFCYYAPDRTVCCGCFSDMGGWDIFFYSMINHSLSYLYESLEGQPLFINNGNILLDGGYPDPATIVDRKGAVIIENIKYGIPNPVYDVKICLDGSILSLYTDSVIAPSVDTNFTGASWSQDGTKFVFVDRYCTLHFYNYIPSIVETSSFSLLPWNLCPDSQNMALSPSGIKVAFNTEKCLFIIDNTGQLIFKRN